MSPSLPFRVPSEFSSIIIHPTASLSLGYHPQKKSHGVVSCSILFLFHLLFEMLNDIQGNKKRRKDLSFFFFLLFQQSVCPTEEEEETGQLLLPHMQLTGATLVQIFAALCHLSFSLFSTFLLQERRGGPLGLCVPGRSRVSGVRLGVCISCPSLARSYYSVTVSFLPPPEKWIRETKSSFPRPTDRLIRPFESLTARLIFCPFSIQISPGIFVSYYIRKKRKIAIFFFFSSRKWKEEEKELMMMMMMMMGEIRRAQRKKIKTIY